MKRQLIPEWDGITDYRSPEFSEYDFIFKIHEHDNENRDPETVVAINLAALNYASEIVGDPSNSKWLERRKLVDAFKMGIKYAERYLEAKSIQ